MGKYIIVSFCFIFLSIKKLQAQSSIPFSEIIENRKPSIIPILGFDSSYGNKYRHLGTGFIVTLDTSQRCFAIITCEHVVMIKDSNKNKTIRPVQKLFANLTLMNDSVILVPIELKVSEEKNDFAMLGMKSDLLSKKYHLKITTMLISSFDTSNNIKEGETLLYIGYPMSFGVGKKSYPISRSGFVSQNIPDSSKFLMDGFVQGGYSGSPVFRIKEIPEKHSWVYKIVGIIQAYPTENAIIKSKDKNNFKVIINPGFTIVGKLNSLARNLYRMRCF